MIYKNGITRTCLINVFGYMAPNNLIFRLLWAVVAQCLLVVGSAPGPTLDGDFVINTRDVITRKGEQSTIDCLVPAGFVPSNLTQFNSNVTSFVTWTKDGSPLQLSSRVYTLSNGSLFIKRVVHRKKRGLSDEGEYGCFARNVLGAVLVRTTQLRVASISKQFITQPRSIRVPGTSKAYFECSIEALPLPVYTWEHNGRVLPQHGSRHKVFKSGVLEIVDVGSENVGMYRCVAQNSVGIQFSREARLSISHQTSLPLQIFSGPSNQSVVIGASVLLECHVLGLPAPTITWVNAENKPVQGSRVGVSSLLMENLRVEDSGVYTCKVEGYESSLAHVASATVTVNERATISEKPSVLSKYYQEEVQVVCGVTGGSPQPSVTWLVNGTAVVPGNRIKIKEDRLVITAAVVDDSGYYQCVVGNDAGVVTAFTSVQIRIQDSIPEPPTNLQIYPLSSSEVRLTWQHSITPDIAAYSVHYCLTEGGQELQDVAPGDSTESYIGQLLPHTNYTFYLKAYAGPSRSLPSEKLLYVTEDAVPAAPPEFDVESFSSTAIKVTWSPLSREHAHGDINHYKIYYRHHLADSWSSIKVGGDTLEQLVTDLQVSTQYDIRVLAGTSKGVPDYLPDDRWPYKTVATLAAAAVEGPLTPEVQLLCLNSTTILSRWQSVPDSSILGYKVYISKQGQPKGNPRILLPHVRNFTFTRLSADTWYDVRVMAFNRRPGQEAWKTIKTPDKDTVPPRGVDVSLSPPHAVTAVAESRTSIRVTWALPISSIDVSHYTLRYKPVHVIVEENSTVGYTFVKCDAQTRTVTGLQPYMVYDISVRSHHNNLVGPFSDEIQVRTLQGLPPPPELIQFTPVESNGIRLNWQTPRNPNGIIHSYLILYTDNDDLPEESWNQRVVTADKTNFTIRDLKGETYYYITMKSQTGAGYGPATLVRMIRTTLRYDTSSQGNVPQGELQDGQLSDQTMGIIIGVSIGVGCIIICITVMLCLKRASICTPPTHDQYSRHNGNGHCLGGHGQLADIGRRLSHPGSEMDTFMPVDRGYEKTEYFLDTKGGNGRLHKVNGKNHHPHKNGIKNGKVPNGHYRNGHNGIDHNHSNHTEESVLHDHSFTYMGLPRADLTFETTLESTMDDIDRSNGDSDIVEQAESASHEKLLPHANFHNGHMVDGTADTGILQNTAVNHSKVSATAILQQDSSDDESALSPPCLSTFKPDLSSDRHTSDFARHSCMRAPDTLNTSQVWIHPRNAGGGYACVT